MKPNWPVLILGLVVGSIFGWFSIDVWEYYSIKPKPGETWQIKFESNPFDTLEITLHVMNVKDSHIQYFYTCKQLQEFQNPYITSSMSIYMFRQCKPTKLP